MSMQGKVVVVTGSNVGIGLETAVGVAAQGATTVLACRNQDKAEAAAKEVTRRTWNDDVHVVVLDLADLASVRKAADEILTRWDRLDVLVNNAGGTWSQPPADRAGASSTRSASTTSGHFYLTNLLAGRGCAPARRRRVVNVTSVGHHFAFSGHALRRPAEREALRRHGGLLPVEAGQRAVHPRAGQAARRQRRHRQRRPSRPGAQRFRHGRRPDRVRWRSACGSCAPSRSARSVAPRRRSTWPPSPDVAAKTGMYWVRCKPGHMSRQARDDAAAARLWDESEQLLRLGRLRPG